MIAMNAVITAGVRECLVMGTMGGDVCAGLLQNSDALMTARTKHAVVPMATAASASFERQRAGEV